MDDLKKKDPIDLTDLVKSSVRDIEDFIKSSIWQDMNRIYQDWSDGLKGDYDSADSIDEFRTIQGVSIAIEYVMRLPEAMKTIAELVAEEKDKNNTRRDIDEG